MNLIMKVTLGVPEVYIHSLDFLSVSMFWHHQLNTSTHTHTRFWVCS